MENMDSNFYFYHMKDCYGNDLSHHPNKSLEELKELANSDDNCVAFNTLGFLKYNVCPVEDLKFLPCDYGPNNGIYIKKNKKIKISVILNIYKRPKHLKEQFDAIMSQTIQPCNIYIWNNGCKDWDFDYYKNHEKVTFFECNRNMGVWPRFLVGMNTNTDYVCVFDDDTIPRSCWFENCINTLKKVDGILGTVGLIFDKGKNYRVLNRYGWPNPNDKITEVDIVCHSWFFKREYLNAYVKDLPDTNSTQYRTSGEDIHFSYALQKFKGLKSYVPPHPKSNLELWGSIPEKAWEYGTSKEAISMDNAKFQLFHFTMRDYISKGFETIMNRQEYLRNYELSLIYFLNKLRKGVNFSLLRYGDDEYSILNENKLVTQEGWTYKKDSILSKHLKETLNIDRKNVYYGISGKNDGNPYIHDYYIENIINKSNFTFASVFCNYNYNKFKSFIQNFDVNIVLIGPECPNSGNIGKAKVIDYYDVEENLAEKWDLEYSKKISDVVELARKYNNQIFFLSAGPISEIFINEMLKVNFENTYIDIGTSIDAFIKGVSIRPYQNVNSNLAKHISNF